MMRAEKVAGDIAEALEIVSGSASPVPTLASLVRRLERKGSEAGGLLDGAIAALDRALVALEEAGAVAGSGGRGGRSRSAANSSGPRSGSSRSAPRRGNTPSRSPTCRRLRSAWRPTSAALESGEERLAGLSREAAEAKARFDKAAAKLSRGRKAAAGDSRRRSWPNCRR